ncbi:MAG TPA: hypothetical protein VL914_05180 [Vicinamibacterales bacterium]|nr:hypothetical protein [Vicinamibacterales bacterium]
MTAPKPPRLAEALLGRLALDNEPLAGDIIEEFRRRNSRFWLWRQLIAALVVQALYAPHPPVALNLTPTDPVVAEWLMWRRLTSDRKTQVSLTGSGVEGIGGLTMVILGFMMSTVIPAIWWFVVGGIGAGVLLGVLKLRARSSKSFNTRPLVLKL